MQLVGKLIIISVVSLLFLQGSVVSANTPSCKEYTQNYASTELQAELGQYDAYVKLVEGMQHMTVSVYTCNDGSPPQQLGQQVVATADGWTKVGTYKLQADTSQHYVLKSDIDQGRLGVERPALLLVPQSMQHMCELQTDGCATKIAGRTGIINPTGSLVNEGTLRVNVVKDPTRDTVRSVGYYVDGRLVHTTEQLEEFDLRYAYLPEQKIARVIRYESGQEIIFEDTTPKYYVDSFGNFVFRTSSAHPVAFGATLLLVLGLLTYLLAMLSGIWRIKRTSSKVDKAYSYSPRFRFVYRIISVSQMAIERTRFIRWVVVCGAFVVVAMHGVNTPRPGHIQG